MNEQTAQLLEKLALRFGTTTEHLWSVLVKQAPITATINLLLMGGLAITVLIVFSRLKRKHEEKNLDFDNFGDAAITFGCFLMLFCLVVWICCDLPTIISGLVNPEYWALQHILSAVD